MLFIRYRISIFILTKNYFVRCLCYHVPHLKVDANVELLYIVYYPTEVGLQK